MVNFEFNNTIIKQGFENLKVDIARKKNVMWRENLVMYHNVQYELIE